MGPADLIFMQITPALLFLNRKHHQESICSERSIASLATVIASLAAAMLHLLAATTPRVRNEHAWQSHLARLARSERQKGARLAGEHGGLQ